MGRNMSFHEKLRRVIIASVLVVVVAGSGFYGVTRLLDSGAQKSKAYASTEDKDVYEVNLSADALAGKYGDISKYVLKSSFMEMEDIRILLSGMTKAKPVSIPMSADQAWIDKKRKELSGSELERALDLKMVEWDAALANLTGAELEAAVREKVTNEILRNPTYADMWLQALDKAAPQVFDQNPRLAKLKKNFDEAFGRTESDGKAIGLSAFMHYESKEAKEAGDTSKLMINMEDNDETGAIGYFYPAAELAELVDRFFEFEGLKTLKSTDNWCLPVNKNPARQRTEEADKQRNEAVYVFTHYTEGGNVSAKIGLNDLDRRIELFREEAPKKFRLFSLGTPDIGGDPDPGGPGKEKLYTGTINYLYKDGGGKVFPSYVNNKMKALSSVTVKSRTLANYTMDKPSVTLTIVDRDVTINVYYSKTSRVQDYPLTVVHYDAKTGYTLRTTPQGRHVAGEKVTGYAVSIPGYTANVSSVSDIMPAAPHTLRIPYTRKTDGDGKKDPEADAERGPGFDPGIGDNKPADKGGNNQSEKLPSNDHSNVAPPTPSKPEDNRNDEGTDKTKPVTKPVVDTGDKVEVKDPNTGSSNVENEQNNAVRADESDAVGYSETSDIVDLESL